MACCARAAPGRRDDHLLPALDEEPIQAARTRDSRTKSGNLWYFGIQNQDGAYPNSGLVHPVSLTPANASDISQLPELVSEDNRAVFVHGKGYVNKQLKPRPVLGCVAQGEKSPPADRRERALQPQDVLDPYGWRTRDPRHQGQVRLHEGALHGDRNERRPTVPAVTDRHNRATDDRHIEATRTGL